MRQRRLLLGMGAAVLAAIAVVTGLDVLRHRRVKVLPDTARGLDSKVRLDVKVHDDHVAAQHGRPVDWSNLKDTLTYLDDFWMAPLLRIVYRHSEKIDAENLAKIKRAILGFRYWMDEPGEDGRCYWSENHQILYASAEFLAGQKFPDEIFTNDGRPGRAHQAAARRRVLTWLEQRWNQGFSEWYSNVYYVEDVAPLCNLIDFAADEEVVTKSKIILDLLLFDVATQSRDGVFVSTMGRAYGRNRRSGQEGNSMRGIIQNIWGFDLPVPDGRRMDGCFLFRENYQVPKVIEAIGRDRSTTVIKASLGLDLTELAEAQRGGDADARIMRQWAMEAFVNPEVVDDSMAYVRRNRMFSNSFLHEFRSLDYTVLRIPGVLPALTRRLESVAHGTPLQRANTYTYRRPDFLLATAQRYHPGTLNDQHHVWSATLSNQLSVFTGHPPFERKGKKPGEADANYWVGPGRLPDAAQHENVALQIYRIPEKPVIGEKGVNAYTHAFFPKERFDRVELRGTRAFGQHGNKFIALIAGSPLAYHERSTEDLIQQGRETTWICEVSTASAEGDFEAFIRRIEGNAASYRDGVLSYQTGDRSLALRYGKEFLVNGVAQDTNYPRHASTYAQTARQAGTMTIEFGGRSLFLDFARAIRREE